MESLISLSKVLVAKTGLLLFVNVWVILLTSTFALKGTSWQVHASSPCGSFEFFKWIFMWMISKYMVIYSPGPLVCHPITIARGLSFSIVSEFTNIPGKLLELESLIKWSFNQTESYIGVHDLHYMCLTFKDFVILSQIWGYIISINISDTIQNLLTSNI